MKYRIPYAPLHAAALAVALTACQTTPPANPALESARRNVEQARADPHVVRYAAVESEQALVALQRAQRAHTEQRDAKLTEHLAYLASQRAQVAHNVAMQRATEDTLQQASVERERIRAEVRAREATRAQAEARTAQQSAQTARAEAERQNQRASALQSQLEELKATNTQRGMVLTLGDVLFDTGSAVLKPAGEQMVRRIAEVMRQHPQQRVLIEGHTDSEGSDEANLTLSRQRAEAFAIPLIRDGIDPSRIEVAGRGEALPVAGNETPAGRQQNRRVEMVFSDQNGRFAGR
jgi:outer membrane protein OmpA-like peptidoglycan-associated protein